METLPQTQSCFACGKNNPRGLNLVFHTDGSQITAAWIPLTQHTGFADTIHGGLIATVLDEIMAWTCGILGGRFAYSVDMRIRYLHPLRPGDNAQCAGTIEENRRSKLFKTRANLRVADTEIASAEGTYLAIKTADEERLWNDFGAKAAHLRDRFINSKPQR